MSPGFSACWNCCAADRKRTKLPADCVATSGEWRAIRRAAAVSAGLREMEQQDAAHLRHRVRIGLHRMVRAHDQFGGRALDLGAPIRHDAAVAGLHGPIALRRPLRRCRPVAQPPLRMTSAGRRWRQWVERQHYAACVIHMRAIGQTRLR